MPHLEEIGMKLIDKVSLLFVNQDEFNNGRAKKDRLC